MPPDATEGWSSVLQPSPLPPGNLTASVEAARIGASAGGTVQTTDTGVGTAEQARDAIPKCDHSHDGNNGDQADEQGVLHHGGATLDLGPLEQGTVEATDRDKCVDEKLDHLLFPLSVPVGLVEYSPAFTLSIDESGRHFHRPF